MGRLTPVGPILTSVPGISPVATMVAEPLATVSAVIASVPTAVGRSGRSKGSGSLAGLIGSLFQQPAESSKLARS